MFLLPKPEITWKSPWRLEQERRRAEEMGSRIFVTAPSTVKTQPLSRYIARSPAQFCSSCGKGMRKGCKRAQCNNCFTERPRCACGKTIYKGGSLAECKECFHRSQRVKCPICPRFLNARNSYGLCKPHYQKYRRFIQQDQLSICLDCPRLINRDNKFKRCVKCSHNFYRRDRYARKAAA